MRTVLAVIGCLLILVGLGIFAYAEIDYNNKMERLLDLRNGFSDLKTRAEQKYIETGELKYLYYAQELLGLYLDTFHTEGTVEYARSQGTYAGGLLTFCGIIVLAWGIITKEQRKVPLEQASNTMK